MVRIVCFEFLLLMRFNEINIHMHNHYTKRLICDDCSIRVYVIAMATELFFI